MNCQFCQKKYDTGRALANHSRRCPNNPNRIIEKMTSDGLERMIRKNKNIRWTDERKLKHSMIMKEAVRKYPESYNTGNKGRVKRIEYDGLSFQGKWELYFYQWCKRNDVKIEKCNEWFEYEWNGIRKYFPDFILLDYEVYVEVKGYKTERDAAKWNQFKKKLLIVDKKDIPCLLNDSYKLRL